MAPIRVLHVFGSLDRGGAETMVMNIYRKIDKEKVQFDFAVYGKGREYAYEKEILSLGGRVFHTMTFTHFNYVVCKRAWKALLAAHPEWQVIHGHNPAAAIVYLSTAKSLKRTAIMHSHSTSDFEPSRLKLFAKIIRKRLCNRILRRMNGHMFACSDEAARWMFGSRAGKARVVPNAIDVEAFAFDRVMRDKIRAEFSVSVIVGHVGNFKTAKNHDFIIDVFACIKKRLPSAALLLVGGGDLTPQIKEKVKRLGLCESVVFAGVCADIAPLLSAMDVFLFPSLSEGLGVALIEAQASGLPCVVSDAVPKAAQITDLVTFISLDRPADEWAETVISRANIDRVDTGDKIREAGFDARLQAQWFEAFYTEVVT